MLKKSLFFCLKNAIILLGYCIERSIFSSNASGGMINEGLAAYLKKN